MSCSEKKAREKYNEYIAEGLKMFPPFKGYGQKFLQFAIDEPEMYRELFMKKRDYSFNEYFEKEMEWDKILPSIQATVELNETDAKWLFKNMMIYAHGMASLFFSSSCVLTEEEIAESIGGVCRGLIMQLKAAPDSRIKVMASEKNEGLGSFNEYIQGKSKFIIGHGEKGQLFRIRIDAILYFEAVGENVFAYTKNDVFDVKQRLYKIEEDLGEYTFLRASKSLLVNVKKIVKIQPADGGRGMITLINGEEVIANRSYYKDIKEKIKEG